MAWETGCVFLVVFRCRYCGEFLPRFHVPPFATLFGLLFGPPHRFVFPFGCVGRAVRGSRRFVQLVGADGCLCSFVSWCRGSDGGGRIVERVGSADGVACRLCVAYSVPCGGAWGGA